MNKRKTTQPEKNRRLRITNFAFDTHKLTGNKDRKNREKRSAHRCACRSRQPRDRHLPNRAAEQAGTLAAYTEQSVTACFGNILYTLRHVSLKQRTTILIDSYCEERAAPKNKVITTSARRQLKYTANTTVHFCATLTEAQCTTNRSGETRRGWNVKG